MDSYTESGGTANSISDYGSSTGTELASFRPLSEHDRQAIAAVIESKYRIKLAQDQVREDLKAVAESLVQERERGNVLLHEKALIDVAEQVVFTPTTRS
jgi:hypothetical protein